jgi:FtsH-binding integral membrane protein
MSNYNINPNNNNYNFNNRNTSINNLQGTSVTDTRSLFASVFLWMFIALGITTLCSTIFAYNESLKDILYTVDAMGRGRVSVLGWIIMLAPLGLVLLMSFAFNKLSFPALISIFFAYSALVGISLSSIFMLYDIGSIVVVFGSTCALFGVMAIAGYTTKADLTKMGSILTIGLIGIVIASLINIFAKSGTMDFIISIIGVIIFTGLTAYDTQKIKNLAAQNDGSSDFKKLAVMGALSLYLDFINLFMMLLRLFGRRD